MKKITVQTIVEKDIETVWGIWSEPKHITHWAFASDDWEAPHTENDLRVDGKFLTRMSAKDKSASFDFTGVYTHVVPFEKIEYRMDDGRNAIVIFEKLGKNITEITEEFEMENENSEETQRNGWQAILNNFKKYAEKN